ncbi:MAG: TonB-dependent receptor [Bacteroidetes bacterium]|nr:TonB-dependent receptor [Bacteroidota bacterium]
MYCLLFFKKNQATLLFFFLQLSLFSYGQSDYKQTIKGYVIDAESKKPLAGITVKVVPGSASAVSDSSGFYLLKDVAVGRYAIQFTSIGYETKIISGLTLSSGKELEQNISLIQKFSLLESFTLRLRKNNAKPLNEFATVSARSFSMDETRRYPAAFSDPARMAMNFPGVSAADDGNNSIVVRGNSPLGVLWKLEGIEIPTPNHFSSLGATGGAISMLSSNVIGKSDFYTGAFPAEIGNATSAVFDLNFRNGNKDKAEHSVMLGTLGAEISTEGPLGKQKNKAYLVNYRYSTLALLKPILHLQGQPDYQDLSFKFNWDTKRSGSFAVFGLGGYNKFTLEAKKDSTKWNSDDEVNATGVGSTTYGVIGLSHQIFVNPNSYFKTVLSASYNRSSFSQDTLNPADNYNRVRTITESTTDNAIRLSSYFNSKLNLRNTIRTGFVMQQLSYGLDQLYYSNTEKKWIQSLQGNGGTQFYQVFFQWKYRITDRLTLNSGVNASYLALNKKSSVEPRVALSYQLNGQTFSIAAGLHSRLEHISTYLFENVSPGAAHTYPNKDLDLSRAAHFVLGYEKFFSVINLRTKIEAYYQYLYKIPVEKNIPSGFSAINMRDVYDLIDTKPLVSTGTGKNYGVDLSVEKPFSNNYYFISNLSIFKSSYTNYAGKEFNSRYDRNYSFSIIGGKEWQSNKNPNKIYGVSAKVLTSGGLRSSVIDIPASIAAGKEILVADKYFTERGPAYLRFDGSIYIKKNRKKSTRTISIDIQNLTNHRNFYDNYFDERTGRQKTAYQLGIIPNISYKIEF